MHLTETSRVCCTSGWPWSSWPIRWTCWAPTQRRSCDRRWPVIVLKTFISRCRQKWVGSMYTTLNGTKQRFVSSIGNIEKAMWVFNCMGRSGWYGQSKIIFQTGNNFPQVRHDYFQKITQIRKSWAPSFSKQKRNVGSSQWLKKLMYLNYKTYFLNQ